MGIWCCMFAFGDPDFFMHYHKLLRFWTTPRGSVTLHTSHFTRSKFLALRITWVEQLHHDAASMYWRNRNSSSKQPKCMVLGVLVALAIGTLHSVVENMPFEVSWVNGVPSASARQIIQQVCTLVFCARPCVRQRTVLQKWLWWEER
jgi:hypothetical protein